MRGAKLGEGEIVPVSDRDRPRARAHAVDHGRRSRVRELDQSYFHAMTEALPAKRSIGAIFHNAPEIRFPNFPKCSGGSPNWRQKLVPRAAGGGPGPPALPAQLRGGGGGRWGGALLSVRAVDS